MSDLYNAKPLLAGVSKDNLYLKLLDQLNKDFCLAGLENPFESICSSELLHAQLAGVVYKLISHQFSDYLNLLYRIDISENQIRALDGTDIKQLSNQVSYLILKRECQKVLARNKF